MQHTIQTKHISEKALASRWCITSKTLQRWRNEGKFIPYLKIGNSIRYSLESIEAFEAENSKTPSYKHNRKLSYIPNRDKNWGLEWQV